MRDLKKLTLPAVWRVIAFRHRRLSEHHLQVLVFFSRLALACKTPGNTDMRLRRTRAAAIHKRPHLLGLRPGVLSKQTPLPRAGCY